MSEIQVETLSEDDLTTRIEKIKARLNQARQAFDSSESTDSEEELVEKVMTHNGTSYLAQKMEVKKNQEEIEIRFNALEQPHLAIRENKRLQTALDESNKSSKKKDGQIKRLKTQLKDFENQVLTTGIEMKAITDAVAHATATIEAASTSTVARIN